MVQKIHPQGVIWVPSSRLISFKKLTAVPSIDKDVHALVYWMTFQLILTWFDLTLGWREYSLLHISSSSISYSLQMQYIHARKYVMIQNVANQCKSFYVRLKVSKFQKKRWLPIFSLKFTDLYNYSVLW